MGNTSSDVNDSLKAQADGSIEVYKLVNLGGGGQLAQLMIDAITSKNYTEIDNFIKTEVIKYLYNNGEGAQVSLASFWHSHCLQEFEMFKLFKDTNKRDCAEANRRKGAAC